MEGWLHGPAKYQIQWAPTVIPFSQTRRRDRVGRRKQELGSRCLQESLLVAFHKAGIRIYVLILIPGSFPKGEGRRKSMTLVYISDVERNLPV